MGRDIAVDKNGGAWITASGSYAGMDNVGGTVWYVQSPGADAVQITGATTWWARDTCQVPTTAN